MEKSERFKVLRSEPTIHKMRQIATTGKWFEMTDETASCDKVYDRDTKLKQIKECMGRHPEGVLSKIIASETKINHSTVRTCLGVLKDRAEARQKYNRGRTPDSLHKRSSVLFCRYSWFYGR